MPELLHLTPHEEKLLASGKPANNAQQYIQLGQRLREQIAFSMPGEAAWLLEQRETGPLSPARETLLAQWLQACWCTTLLKNYGLGRVFFDEASRIQIEQLEQELLQVLAQKRRTAPAVRTDVKANRERMINRLRRLRGDHPAVKMQRIMNAMNRYYQVNRQFPGASVGPKGANGFSWRVWLLPHFNDPQMSALYEQFHLDQAWDSPQNLKMAAQMPDVYKLPEVAQMGKTTLHVFSGPSTPFQKPIWHARITDGTLNTIAVVRAGLEKADVWTRPGGLSFDPQRSLPEQLGAPQAGGYFFLFFDGRVWRFPQDISTQAVWMMIQPADGSTEFHKLLGRGQWWKEWAARREANRAEAKAVMDLMSRPFGE